MKTKVKYNKCKTCENAGWSMPQCAECNRANGFRYYHSGRPLAPNGRDYLNPEDMVAEEYAGVWHHPFAKPRHPNPPNTGSNVMRPINRESLWQSILDNFKVGLYGEQGKPETMLRYWKAQEAAGYPSASENVQYFEMLVEKEGPTPTARWKGAGMGDYYCSLCQHQMSGRTKFCPECGAKMDEWEEGEG